MRTVTGIGQPLALAAGAKVPGLYTFPGICGRGVSFPSTQGALFAFLGGSDQSELHTARPRLAACWATTSCCVTRSPPFSIVPLGNLPITITRSYDTRRAGTIEAVPVLALSLTTGGSSTPGSSLVFSASVTNSGHATASSLSVNEACNKGSA
jgi:hypothetical protein